MVICKKCKKEFIHLVSHGLCKECYSLRWYNKINVKNYNLSGKNYTKIIKISPNKLVEITKEKCELCDKFAKIRFGGAFYCYSHLPAEIKESIRSSNLEQRRSNRKLAKNKKIHSLSP